MERRGEEGRGGERRGGEGSGGEEGRDIMVKQNNYIYDMLVKY